MEYCFSRALILYSGVERGNGVREEWEQRCEKEGGRRGGREGEEGGRGRGGGREGEEGERGEGG